MKYKHAQEFAEDLREFADFIETSGVKLSNISPAATFNAYLAKHDFVKDPETGEYEYVLNEAKTRRNIRSFIKAVGTCTKEFNDTYLDITHTFKNGRVSVLGIVTRNAVCKKVPTGNTIKHEATYTPEYEEAEYEWDCTDAESLIALTSR